MKQLLVNMKAELSNNDLVAALLSTKNAEEIVTEIFSMSDVLTSYVKTHKPDVTKAVNKWLSETHQLTTDKVVYQGDRVLVEGHGANGTAKRTEDRKARVRTAPEGFKKTNKAIFSFLREYLDDERKKKVRVLDFKKVFVDTKFFFPRINERLLSIYLNDKRQLKNTVCDKRRNTVTLTDVATA